MVSHLSVSILRTRSRLSNSAGPVPNLAHSSIRLNLTRETALYPQFAYASAKHDAQVRAPRLIIVPSEHYQFYILWVSY
jgi:hypothetical protein